MEMREAIHPDAYLSGLVGWLVVGSVHFGSFRFGSGWFVSFGWFGWFGLVWIFDLHKKIF